MEGPPRPLRPQKGPSGYPEPHIIHPKYEHRHTFIILHGRGSNGSSFGTELLATPLADSTQTLREIFPYARFVFPTASLRRATLYKRSLITQWFDNWSHDSPLERQELQIDGLRESSAFIHVLLKEEIELVGGENIALGGLSQGCATALISFLTWDGAPLPAIFGLCGWLPFRKMLHDSVLCDTERGLVDGDGASDYNPFSFSGGDDDNDDDDRTIATKTTAGLNTANLDTRSAARHCAVTALFEELDIAPQPLVQLSLLKTPVFLGHGSEDDKVPLERGYEARNCLTLLDVELTWKEYEGLGHWYSGTMLADLVHFLKEKTGW